MMKIKLLLCFLLLSNFLSGQTLQITGKVIDSLTLEALAFVHVIPNNNPQQGTNTDIDGNFSFETKEKIQTLTFTYLGYRPLIYKIEEGNNKLRIKLSQSVAELTEAVVVAGENPAHRIIRKATANKKQNNPFSIPQFTCKTYNKMVLDILPNYEYFQENYGDTAVEKFQKAAKLRHIALMESVTNRKYLAPLHDEEHIEATRVSGLKNPFLAPLATDLQPFAFYSDLVEVLDKKLLNPISKGSTKKYYFEIKDTLYQQQDSVFIIAFQPRSGKLFDGLKGVLYINTNGYAIQNVIAEPADKSLINLEIEQQYELVEGKYWFPSQLNYTFRAESYPSNEMGMLIQGKSYISEANFEPNLRKRDFGIDNVVITEEATEARDSVYWQEHQIQRLTAKELRTYAFVDSLGEANNFDQIVKISQTLSTGKIPLGIVDWDVTRFFAFNEYEGFRLNLSLMTNQKISKHFTLGGYVGYGFRDKAWKYSGFLELHPFKNSEFKWQFRYLKEVQEVGTSILKPKNTLTEYFAEKMNAIEEWQSVMSFRLFKYAMVDLNINRTEHQPLYEYTFAPEQLPLNDFGILEAGVRVRYAFKEKYLKTLGQRYSLGSQFPIYTIAYAKGIPALGGEFDYHKVEAQMTWQASIKGFGTLSFFIKAGRIWGDVPYDKVFNGFGIDYPQFPAYVPHAFNTLKRNEIAVTDFAIQSFTHDLGSFFKIKKFQPRFGYAINTIQSSGQNDFLEGGILIHDLYKLNYLNMAKLGLGLGVFYGYGKTLTKDWDSRIRLKLLWRIST